MLILQGRRPFLEKLSKTQKEEGKRGQNDKKPQRTTYPECPTCSKTNHERNVGVVLVPIFVQKEIDKTPPKIRSPLKTKALAPRKKNPQRPHQANRLPKSLNQKTNFATTPNL